MVSCCGRVHFVKDRNLKAGDLIEYETLMGDVTMVPMNPGEQKANPRSAMSRVTSNFFSTLNNRNTCLVFVQIINDPTVNHPATPLIGKEAVSLFVRLTTKDSIQ
jgi:hypothetical protein